MGKPHRKDGFKYNAEGLRKGFEYFDRNKNGSLSAEELRAILINPNGNIMFDEEAATQVANTILRRFAKDDGLLQYEEVGVACTYPFTVHVLIHEHCIYLSLQRMTGCFSMKRWVLHVLIHEPCMYLSMNRPQYEEVGVACTSP